MTSRGTAATQAVLAAALCAPHGFPFLRVRPGGPAQVPPAERLNQEVEVDQRVALLVETTCFVLFSYVAQGLFERHKLIVATQLCMQILRSRGELHYAKFEHLLRGPRTMGVDNPLHDWVSDSVWGSVQALKELDDYSVRPGAHRRCSVGLQAVAGADCARCPCDAAPLLLAVARRACPRT